MDAILGLYKLLVEAIKDPVILILLSLATSIFGTLLAKPISRVLYKFNKRYRFRKAFELASVLNESRLLEGGDLFTTRLFESLAITILLGINLILTIILFSTLSILSIHESMEERSYVFYAVLLFAALTAVSLISFRAASKNLRFMINAKLGPEEAINKLDGMLVKQAERFTEVEATEIRRYANGEISASEVMERFPQYVSGIKFHDRLLNLRIDQQS